MLTALTSNPNPATTPSTMPSQLREPGLMIRSAPLRPEWPVYS